MLFRDRVQAGRLLGEKLEKFKAEECLVLALPKGGVPVATEVAKKLQAPIEVLIVRKVGAPFNPEIAIGAICEDGEPQLSHLLLAQVEVNPLELAEIIKAEKKEIARQVHRFRHNRPLPDLTRKTVIVIDDGLATGATVSAAVRYLRTKMPERIIVAVPVAAATSARNMRLVADECVALEVIEDLLSVGHWYEDFSQVPDEAVVANLKTKMLGGFQNADSRNHDKRSGVS